jgi:hypothetical protein
MPREGTARSIQKVFVTGKIMQAFLIRLGLGLAFVVLQEILGRLRRRGDFHRALRFAQFHAKAYEALPVSGEEKKKMVEEALRSDLRRLGIEMKRTVVNLLIEMAVNKLRKELGVPGYIE